MPDTTGLLDTFVWLIGYEYSLSQKDMSTADFGSPEHLQNIDKTCNMYDQVRTHQRIRQLSEKDQNHVCNMMIARKIRLQLLKYWIRSKPCTVKEVYFNSIPMKKYSRLNIDSSSDKRLTKSVQDNPCP